MTELERRFDNPLMIVEAGKTYRFTHGQRKLIPVAARARDNCAPGSEHPGTTEVRIRPGRHYELEGSPQQAPHSPSVTRSHLKLRCMQHPGSERGKCAPEQAITKQKTAVPTAAPADIEWKNASFSRSGLCQSEWSSLSIVTFTSDTCNQTSRRSPVKHGAIVRSPTARRRCAITLCFMMGGVSATKRRVCHR